MQKVWDFPSAADKVKVDKIISSFPNGLEQVKSMGISYMRFIAATEVNTYASVKAVQQIFDQIQDAFLPAMKAAAKSAFQSAAKDYLSSQRAAIIAKAFIPIVGTEKAREMLATAKEEAEKRGTAAAWKAAEDKKTEMMPMVNAKAKELTQQAVGDGKEAVKTLIKIAVQVAKKELTSKK